MRGLPARLLTILMLLSPVTGVAQIPEGEVAGFVEGDVACPRIAMVFTVGMGGPPSQSILRLLVKNDVPATMFPTGEFARNHPEYLQRLDAVGFEIGTHGDTDLLLTDATDEAIRADIRSSIDAIEGVIERPIDPYFTPYAGTTDERVRAVVASEGLLSVGWHIPSPDWNADATAEDVYNTVTHSVYPGAIVGMHIDGPATEQSLVLALPRLIDDLRTRGFEFVTIGGMLEPCPTAKPVATDPITMAGLDVHGLHCKVAPSQGASTIRILFNGDAVTPRGPVFDGWLPVECASRDGWIKKSALP